MIYVEKGLLLEITSAMLITKQNVGGIQIFNPCALRSDMEFQRQKSALVVSDQVRWRESNPPSQINLPNWGATQMPRDILRPANRPPLKCGGTDQFFHTMCELKSLPPRN